MPIAISVAIPQTMLTDEIERTILVFRIVNMAFDISTVFSCQPLAGFVLIPLPSGTTQWEARDLDTWSREFELNYRERTIYGLSDTGDLKMLRQRGSDITINDASWEPWLASVGSIGGLVLMAGSLL